MALRGTKLIFPNFIGSKSGLASSVNPDLEVGETIHEKDTNRYKTNLTAETASWNSLPYGAQFISFPLASEFKTYLSGSGDQVVYIEEFEKIYKQTSLVSSSTYTEPDYIIDNNDIVYASVTQGLGFPFSGSAVITGSLLISGSGTVLTASGSSLITEDLTVQGRTISTEKQIISGSSYLVPVIAQGATGDTVYLTGSNYDNVSIVRAIHDNGSNGVLTLVLPHSTGSNELHRTIRIISNGSADAQHNIDIIPPAGDTLDGSSSGFTINRSYEGLMVWSDGTEWFRIQSKG